jgi:hypothetical protein
LSYSSTDTYDACKAVIYCATEAGVRWASRVLYDISVENIMGPDFKHEFNVMSKKCKKPGPNHGRIEVSAVLNFTPDAAIAALIKTGLSPETEELVLKPGSLSVGPCSYEDETGIYVKVRFNGFSVPFYFNEKRFLPDFTEQAVTKQIGGVNAEAAYKIVTDNQDLIYKRAVTRALNLSNIDDYATHNLKILKGDNDGRFYTATQSEIADPKAKLASLFSYGYRSTFAVIDDEVYKVKGVVSGYQLYNSGERLAENQLTDGHYDLNYVHGGITYRGYLRCADCTKLDPRDQYVREKIGRSMKAKL